MNQPVVTTYPKGISGKRLVVGVVVSLATIILIGFWCLRTYGHLTASRDATDAVWRKVATVLELRYQGLGELVGRGVNSRQIDIRWGEQWRSAIDHFNSSTIADTQRAAASEIEELIGQLPLAFKSSEDALELRSQFATAAASTVQLDQVLAAYRHASEEEQLAAATLGVRALDFILDSRRPQEFAIAQP